MTLEDVLGGPPRGEEPKRPEGPFGTLAGLLHAAMRQHARRAALIVWESGRAEPLPDWKFDRTAIRLALFARERLGARAGDRVAVFGRLHWLWPVAEFAILGLGGTSVGIPHDVGDDELALALAAAAPRFALATDAASAARLLSLPGGVRPPAAIVPDGLPVEADGDRTTAHSLSEVFGLGGSLDTPEGAGSFRSLAASLDPQGEALLHWAPSAAGSRDGCLRLTHKEALDLVLRRQEARPSRAGDVACFEGPRVGLETRLRCLDFIGDGVTTSALGGGAERQASALRPHVVVAGEGEWLRGLAAETPRSGEGLLAKLARAAGFTDGNGSGRPQGALLQRLGDRLRRIESDGPLDAGVVAACAAAGVEVVSAVS